MPRGRRAGTGKTIYLQIAELDTEMEKYKNRITDAREKKAELAKKKSQGHLSELIGVNQKEWEKPGGAAGAFEKAREQICRKAGTPN